MEKIQADYLVVGAGAMGMAFTDTLVAETDAHVVLVDRGHAPGGHWTRAYPFVRLHQPSAYYGVNPRPLGSDTVDRVGWNEGLYELATGGEVCAYFDQVMHQHLLPSGQVSYFPMAEYLGDAQFRTLAGTEYTLMQWLCAARLDLLRHMYAPLMDQPRVRDKLLALIVAGLRSANEKLQTLLSVDEELAGRP